MKNLSQIISELARPDEKFIIFCGAGISANSGVPLAIPFLSKILDGFRITKKDKVKLIFRDNRLAMPFELFFDVFLKNPADYALLDVFKIGGPNTNHLFIAECALSGKCDEVYTTNFDTHIETAFKLKHQKLKGYAREDQFQAAIADIQSPKLIKLHGSIDDVSSIRTTLSSIAKRSLSDERKTIIDHLFLRAEHTRMLILGYSCSDYFDIVDRIENIRGSAVRIYFIDHYRDIKDSADA
ncbi:MAG TPA: SIR2 family protein, partial [Mucilaginibacter sp.]|nr:SIR2 family protein [Mucilaginibacter sp.]